MGKTKRKGRSVKNNKQVQDEREELVQAPHSFIIHRGLPGGHVEEITKDFRKVMEPFTATSLKERKKNTIKDFVQISGVLHISHMCIFTRTDMAMYLKIGKMSRGPTLTFKIHSFTLSKDVITSLKKQYVYSECFKHSPLVVLNSFSGEGMHMKLMASTFQNMFPTINLTNIDLNTIRRCVMLNYNPTSKLIDFRHYAIKAIPVGISKGIKKVVQGKVPNLAKCNDISDFLTKSAILSDSEFEDDPNSHVTLPQKLSSRGNMENSQSAIRLSELGPRITLQLMKVEDGLLDGEVLFHELVHKTEEEKEAIKKKRDEKRKLKEKRKKEQQINTQKKEDKKDELKKKSLDGMKKGRTEQDRLMRQAAKESNIAVQVEEDDDAEYYRQEVGEEPEKELFTSNSNRKRSIPPKDFKSKKPRYDEKEGKSKYNDKFHAKKNLNKSDKKLSGRSSEKTRSDRSSEKKWSGRSSDKKWPGGRGGNPKYGVNAKNDDSSNTDKKLKKVHGSKINKNKMKNKRR